MERQIYFSEKPNPFEWGKKRIVPLNVKPEETVENGQRKVGYRADIVRKVELPITVDTIVDAAIAEEYDEAALKRIMRNLAKTDNEEVQRYKNFVEEVTSAAKAAGYE